MERRPLKGPGQVAFSSLAGAGPTLQVLPVGVPNVLAGRRPARLGAGYGPARWLGAGLFGAAVVGLVVSIATGSAEAFARYGLGFVWSGTWNPAAGDYAAGVLVVGTVVTTALAMLLVAPIGLGAAIAISELLPRKLAAVFSSAIELLAAVPSIVVGLWALLVLSPIFAAHVEPAFGSVPGLGWFFRGPYYGSSIMLASVVLTIMALPTMVALSRTAFTAVPAEAREAALALGATRWQVARKVVFASARSGVGAALTLAVGRALGEAIAVAMVIGNRPALPHSLAGPGSTLGSAIVNQFAEATSSLSSSAVIALGAVLLVLTVAVNIGGQLLRRSGRGAGARSGPLPAPVAALAAGQPVLPERTLATRAHGVGVAGESLAEVRRRLQRRLVRGKLGESLCSVALIAAAAPLVALVVYTIAKGAGGLSLGFLVHAPVPVGVPGGGISTAIVGSARTVGLAILIAAPVGLLAALFLYERSGTLSGTLRFCADVLTGVPSIVIGIFAYTAIVRPMHGASVFAAGFALAVLMVPIMVRADEEAIRSVPVDLQEAAAALGAKRSRVVRSVVLRESLPGLVAGNLLAVSRAVGETAPLLFTLAAPTMALTLLIYDDGTQAFPQAQQTAWSAALVLLALVLILSVAARAVAWALTRRAR